MRILWRKFSWNASYIIHIHVGAWSTPNFAEKTFAGGSQAATMGKVIELPTHLSVKHMILWRYIHVYVCIPTFTCSYMYMYGEFLMYVYLLRILMYLSFVEVEFGISAEATLEHLKWEDLILFQERTNAGGPTLEVGTSSMLPWSMK